MQHKIHHEILPNGISLIVVPMTNTETVTSVVYMGVGSRYESDAQQGLAHFTEHMVFKGGKKYVSAQMIAQTMDGVGGEFNAFTSNEYTAFYTKTDAVHTELGLDLLSDIVLHAQFPEDELTKEKGVIVEEINMYEDMPMRKVGHLLMAQLFGDTPLGRQVLGTKESVNAFTREDFTKYREQFYMGAKCTVSVAGNITVEKAKQLVWAYFSELPNGEAYTAQPAAFVQGGRAMLDVRDSEQTHLIISLEAFQITDPRHPILRVLNTVLGGNMSSRLFTSVREEQGLCYYVRSGIDSYTDVGFVYISAGVDNNRFPQAVSAIVTELKKIVETPISEEELSRAKQYLHGRTAMSFESSEDVAEYYGEQDLLEHVQETAAEYQEKIKTVTVEQVHELARELCVGHKLRLVAVGPYSNTAAIEQLLVI